MNQSTAVEKEKGGMDETKNGRPSSSTLVPSDSPFPLSSSLFPIGALCRREVLKFMRERSRVIGALLQPLGLWMLLGLGFQGTFQLPGGGPGYLEFLFPGVIVMVLLFTSIFSTITVVEERQTGFLQAALVAPVPRTALVLGHALGGTLLATGQAALFLLLLPIVGLRPALGGLALALLVCVLTALAFTALGFAIAWRMDSTRGYHTVMTIVLMPLWFLSGAPFPAEGAALPIRWLIWANPVSYAVSGLRQALYWPGGAPVHLAAPGICLLVIGTFALLMLALAVHTVRRPIFD